MAKVIAVQGSSGVVTGYYYDCPGCWAGHEVAVRPHRSQNGASWDFNGDLDSPTFTPSILARWTPSPESGKPEIVCHHFVRSGKIEFLSDCTHSKAGQTVEMIEV